MNEPEYIVTDEFSEIVNNTLLGLRQKNIDLGNDPGWPVLRYEYGYIRELNQTLQQAEGNEAEFDKKYPLIWLAEPFTVVRDDPNFFGRVKLDIFIIVNTDPNYKAHERMLLNYKPIIYPIYRELMNQIALSVCFTNSDKDNIENKDSFIHTLTKGYYWGDSQKQILNDNVDCLKIGSLELNIHNNQNNQNCSNILI